MTTAWTQRLLGLFNNNTSSSKSVAEQHEQPKFHFFEHYTTLENLKSIVESGFVYTAYERWLHDVKASGINYHSFEEYGNRKYQIDLFEFPGIYTRYQLKGDNYNGGPIHENAVRIVFSPEILQKQKKLPRQSIRQERVFHGHIDLFPREY